MHRVEKCTRSTSYRRELGSLTHDDHSRSRLLSDRERPHSAPLASEDRRELHPEPTSWSAPAGARRRLSLAWSAAPRTCLARRFE